jgi:hypothetical protein
MTHEWARQLEHDKTVVLHVSGVIAKVKKFWSGDEGDRYCFALIELETGDTFVAVEANFIPLTEHQAKFYELAQKVLNHAIKETIQLAAGSGWIELPSVVVLVEAAIKAQLRALQAESLPDPYSRPSP